MSRQKIKQDNETMQQYMARLKRNREARLKRQVYADLGMKRVKGSQGGTYYE